MPGSSGEAVAVSGDPSVPCIPAFEATKSMTRKQMPRKMECWHSCRRCDQACRVLVDVQPPARRRSRCAAGQPARLQIRVPGNQQGAPSWRSVAGSRREETGHGPSVHIYRLQVLKAPPKGAKLLVLVGDFSPERGDFSLRPSGGRRGVACFRVALLRARHRSQRLLSGAQLGNQSSS